jgi:hypothetical protein
VQEVLMILGGPLVGGGLALAGVWWTQRSSRRQRERDDRDAVTDKIETVCAELLAAVFDLRLAMVTQHPQWNTWEPRLRTGLRAAVEFLAGRHSAGVAYGVLMASRAVDAFQERSTAAAQAMLGVPVQRFTTALSRAVLLPDKAVADAAGNLGIAAMAALSAYGADGLYRPKAAEAGRRAADDAVDQAAGAVTDAVRRRREPAPRRWWPRRRSA